MKKFYLTLMLLATTTAMFAQKAQPIAVNEFKDVRTLLQAEQTAVEIKTPEFETTANFSTLAVPTADIAGTYDLQYYGLLTGDNGEKTMTVIISVTDEATGAITIAGLWGYTVNATYDSATGSITIPYQHLNFNTTYNEYETFVSVYANDETESFDPTRDDFVLAYDSDANSWKSSGYYGIVGETEEGNFTNSEGWYRIAGGMVICEPAPSTWSSIGTGTFFDGAATVLFGITATEVSVEIQKNDEAEGEYRVVNPFGETMNRSSYLVFDISNPANVIIKPQTFGVTESTMGTAYVMNYAGFLVSQGMSADDVVTNYADYLCPFDESTRRVSMPVGLWFMRFENQTNTNYIYYSSSGQESYIVLPENLGSIEGIGADDSNAPVEYFNLQGMKVNSPAAGQIVIKRQGSKVSKIAVR